MKTLKTLLALAALGGVVTTVPPAYADPDKDESGHGRHYDGNRKGKEEYWDGNCKVERKWEKDGGYKEERKCRGHAHVEAPLPAPEPGVVITLPPIVIGPR